MINLTSDSGIATIKPRGWCYWKNNLALRGGGWKPETRVGIFQASFLKKGCSALLPPWHAGVGFVTSSEHPTLRCRLWPNVPSTQAENWLCILIRSRFSSRAVWMLLLSPQIKKILAWAPLTCWWAPWILRMLQGGYRSYMDVGWLRFC